jgi:hypothetical protein
MRTDDIHINCLIAKHCLSERVMRHVQQQLLKNIRLEFPTTLVPLSEHLFNSTRICKINMGLHLCLSLEYFFNLVRITDVLLLGDYNTEPSVDRTCECYNWPILTWLSDTCNDIEVGQTENPENQRFREVVISLAFPPSFIHFHVSILFQQCIENAMNH